jgi:hypothetical protein
MRGWKLKHWAACAVGWSAILALYGVIIQAEHRIDTQDRRAYYDGSGRFFHGKGCPMMTGISRVITRQQRVDMGLMECPHCKLWPED